MAATVEEKFRSETGNLDSHQIGYLVQDAVSLLDALAAVSAYAPVTYGSLPLADVNYTELRYPDLWDVSVTYSKTKRQQADTDDSEYSFDVSLENQHINYSLSTTNSYVATGTATDYKQAIKCDPVTKKPEGIDVRIPIGSFSITWYPAAATVDSTYQNALLDMVGKVNNDTFNGRAAGEVLFVGASGRQRNTDDWEIVYRFEVRPNRTGIAIGAVTGVAVDGWDVLWVQYERDTDNNELINKPKQVNVERVYERTDLNNLFP